MHLRMTRQAAAPYQALIRELPIGQATGKLQVIGMAYVRVALLAQERHRSHQQGMLIGTMRRVAIQT